jgi:hypothetical protein
MVEKKRRGGVNMSHGPLEGRTFNGGALFVICRLSPSSYKVFATFCGKEINGGAETALKTRKNGYWQDAAGRGRGVAVNQALVCSQCCGGVVSRCKKATMESKGLFLAIEPW